MRVLTTSLVSIVALSGVVLSAALIGATVVTWSAASVLQAAADTTATPTQSKPAESSAKTEGMPVPATAWASFRNGNTQRGIATCTFTDKPELLWEFPTEHGWVTSVAIVGDHVYAPSLTGYLYCLDVKTGKEIWKYRSIEDPDPKEFAPGFKAAPLVTKDAIYLGDEDGVIHAVDRASGQKNWTFTTEAEIAGGAAILDDRIIVGSHDSFLYCFNPDGTLEWKIATEDRINCSAAIAGGSTFVTGCDEHLRVIDIRESKETLAMNLGTYLIASPAIVDNMLYVGTHDDGFLAVDWKEARIVWHDKDDGHSGYHASASVTDDFVLVGGLDKQMHCIDRKSGKTAWTFPTRAQIESSPAVVDDRVFFGSDDGNIYGLDIADGKELWKFNAGHDVSAGIAIGEGVLIVGEEGSDGKLYCFGSK